jgi:small subunit ribosomal protein S8e
VRVRGGNYKHRALRLEAGNFSWGSEGVSRKTRVLTVVYNASNNELVRTNTLVKGAVIQIDATPFRQWYESHYAQVLGKKKAAAAKTEEVEHAADKKSNAVQKKIAARQATAAVDPLLDDQFAAGRLYAIIASRPGQSGRCDGYILEGKELEFYVKKIKVSVCVIVTEDGNLTVVFSIVQEALDSPTFDKTICSVFAYLSSIKVIDLFVYIMNLLFCIVFCVVSSGGRERGGERWNVGTPTWVGGRTWRKKKKSRQGQTRLLPSSFSFDIVKKNGTPTRRMDVMGCDTIDR